MAVAQEKRRHCLGTKLPGAHFGHAAPLLQKSKGGTFWARGLRGTLWSRRASCGREKAAPFGHEASRAHFGHAAPLAEENRRHLLGTRLPGHTLVTLRLLQKRKGGTFWAQGFQGTLWSRRASCGRVKAAPFGHEASRAHFGHAARLAEEKRRHLLGTRPPPPAA